MRENKMVPVINLNTVPFYVEIKPDNTRTIVVSEKYVPFATQYDVISRKTNVTKRFEFTHSDGSEWAPKSRYMYTSTEGHVLAVSNDAEIVKKSADAYLKAKLRK